MKEKLTYYREDFPDHSSRWKKKGKKNYLDECLESSRG